MGRYPKSLESIAIQYGCGGSIGSPAATSHQIQGVGVLPDRDEVLFESFRHMQHLRPNLRYGMFVAGPEICARNRYLAGSVLKTSKGKVVLTLLYCLVPLQLEPSPNVVEKKFHKEFQGP